MPAVPAAIPDAIPVAERRALLAMALGCAVTVGNLYFAQPLLVLIARDYGLKDAGASAAATLAQVGYAVGMLTIVPLGDALPRRRLALTTLAASILALAAVAFAPNLATHLVAQFALGIATCTPQILVPFAAQIAPPRRRARAVGTVMSGLLIGILLGRSYAGVVGAAFGWRWAYVGSALLAAALIPILRAALPEGRPEGPRPRYRDLLLSVADYVRRERDLRRAMIIGATVFAAFSAFWTGLTYLLESPVYGLSAERAANVAGLFGLVGAAGAMVPALAGRLVDHRGPRMVQAVGLIVVLLAFGAFGLFGAAYAGLVVGVLLLDVGAQASHIANQSRVYGIDPPARSRLNTAYMTAYFVGGAAGSALGAAAWRAFEWSGVSAVGVGCVVLAGVAYVAGLRPSSIPPAVL